METQLDLLHWRLHEIKKCWIFQIENTTGLLHDLSCIVASYGKVDHLLEIRNLDEDAPVIKERTRWLALDRIPFEEWKDAQVECRDCRKLYRVWQCLVFPQCSLIICYACNYKKHASSRFVSMWTCNDDYILDTGIEACISMAQPCGCINTCCYRWSDSSWRIVH